MKTEAEERHDRRYRLGRIAGLESRLAKVISEWESEDWQHLKVTVISLTRSDDGEWFPTRPLIEAEVENDAGHRVDSGTGELLAPPDAEEGR